MRNRSTITLRFRLLAPLLAVVLGHPAASIFSQSPSARGDLNAYKAMAKVLDPYVRTANNPAKTLVKEDVIADWSMRLKRTSAPPIVFSTNAGAQSRGVFMHRSQIVVQLAPEADPGKLAEHLATLKSEFGLNVVESVPQVGVLTLELSAERAKELQKSFAGSAGITHLSSSKRREEAASSVAIESLIEKLKALPWIRSAAANTLIGVSTLPPSSKAKGSDFEGVEMVWDWSDGPTSAAATKRDGNWGLKYVNFPAAWNFRDAMKRRNPNASAVLVGILDTGFGTHEDVVVKHSAVTLPGRDDHGYHVSGIIGATWDENVGINGCMQSVEMIGSTMVNIPFASNVAQPQISFILSDVISNATKFILEHPDVKVINISLGYNWTQNEGVNANQDENIQKIVRAHGRIMRTVAELAEESGIILVSAAGNDSREGQEKIEAVWASPFNWAALNQDVQSPGQSRNVIVVESINREGKASVFSNAHGCVSAPGERILSAVATSNPFRDFPTPPATSNTTYAAFDGTSMAAPHVTGLIGLMYTYNPKLKIEDVLRILGVENRPAVARPAPVINAFEALLACRPEAYSDLADLDANGTVDMADFSIFKQHLAQAENRGGNSDLNGDGAVGPNENLYPRADLNGSGKLSRDPSDRKTLPNEQTPLSDLDIMKKGWTGGSPPALESMLDN